MSCVRNFRRCFPIFSAAEGQMAELALSLSCVSLGKEANIFVLNVPGRIASGICQLLFGLGWISQGGEEMGQSSTHILRQFHAGFLTNAKAFLFFFSAPPPLTGTTDDQGCISPGAGVGIFAGSSSWKGPPRSLDRRCVPCLGRSCSSWGGSCVLSPCQMPPSSPRCP